MVGCKLGEIATRRFSLVPEGVPVIQVDIVAEEIGRTGRNEVGIWADAACALDDLGTALGGVANLRADDRSRHAAEVPPRMAAWRVEAHEKLETAERPIAMGRLITELNATLPPESILVADGGFAGHWTGLLFDTKRAGRAYVADRGFASIGYGLPGAIGTKLGAPDAPVVALTGDGGFNMSIGDLETARRLGLGIVMVVVNNAASGYVKALQHAVFDGRYQSSDLVELDYAGIARAFGCRGIRVEDPAELRGAICDALEDQGVPVVLDVIVTRDPARMLPGVDNRAPKIVKGDRIA